MLSFDVHGGRAEAFALVNRLKLITRATSLGGPETLIEHRASVEGAHTRAPESLLRVSIGLEHPDDLIEDLRRRWPELRRLDADGTMAECAMALADDNLRPYFLRGVVAS